MKKWGIEEVLAVLKVIVFLGFIALALYSIVRQAAKPEFVDVGTTGPITYSMPEVWTYRSLDPDEVVWILNTPGATERLVVPFQTNYDALPEPCTRKLLALYARMQTNELAVERFWAAYKACPELQEKK